MLFQQLLGARQALTEAPEGARFRWRATCTWMNGTHSRSNVKEFFGLGADQKHRTEFTFEADHPELFAAEDNGATPVEYVLVGLGSCLTAGIAAVAQHRNIQLRSVAATINGEAGPKELSSPAVTEWQKLELKLEAMPEPAVVVLTFARSERREGAAAQQPAEVLLGGIKITPAREERRP